jgi:hypothetical protein
MAGLQGSRILHRAHVKRVWNIQVARIAGLNYPDRYLTAD